MTVKAHSPYRVLFHPALYFSVLTRTYPDNGKMLGWFALCAFFPVLCALTCYIRFYQALGSEQPIILYVGILLSGLISEMFWTLGVLVLGYLWLGPQARAAEIGVASLTPFLLWGVVLLVCGLLLPFPADLEATKAILEKEMTYFNSSDIARYLFAQIQHSLPFKVMFYSGMLAFAYQACLLLLGFRQAGLTWVRTLLAVLVITFVHVVCQVNLNATWRFLDHGIVTEKMTEAPTEF
ncbi:hypothetical protein [Deinococcus roseus]|uniref:Yip1 domain-containing protein n=1 Tax=Deinococcus roseus TaxID=392414 RepID=A0ABQ2DHD9_9DEIO|nr:hypothetical protein [Deinococcus roseus]GGJ56286.1 hypothetical protein GCM10008938_48080 [Deinococcus roseus]